MLGDDNTFFNLFFVEQMFHGTSITHWLSTTYSLSAEPRR